jgi:hypothetical protein
MALTEVSSGLISSVANTQITGTITGSQGGTGLTSFTTNGVVYASSTNALATGSGFVFDGSNAAIGTNTTLSFSNYRTLRVGGSSTTIGLISAYDGTTDVRLSTANNSVGYVGTQSNNALAIQTNGIEVARFNTSGYLGIGTSSPNYSLTSYAAGAVANYIQVVSGATGAGSGNGLLLGVDSSGNSVINAQGSINLNTYVAGVLRTTIDSNGNLGIGTSSPTNPLTVTGTANASYPSSKGIVVDYTGSSTGVVVPIGFSWSSSVGTQNPYWGMGLIPASFGAGTAALGYYISGSEQMRLTSTGLGIGTSSPNGKLSLQGAFGTTATSGLTIQSTGSTTGLLAPIAFYLQSSSWGTVHQATITAQQVDGANGGANLIFSTSATGQFAPTERMRIDSSGNLLVNTTANLSGARLYVAGAGGTSIAVGDSTNASYRGLNILGGSGDGTIYGSFSMELQGGNLAITSGFSSYGGFITFNNNGSEHARIDTSGNLLVGTTQSGQADGNYGQLRFFGGGGFGLQTSHVTGTASGQSYAYFVYGGIGIGSITQNGTTAVLYNTTSDYRLKENVTTVTTGLATITALNPINFDWISDKRNDTGFLAHEFQAVIPNAVVGEKDAVDSDGKPVYQQMDNSGAIPYLVAAIKELNAEIQSLKVEVATLKGA